MDHKDGHVFVPPDEANGTKYEAGGSDQPSSIVTDRERTDSATQGGSSAPETGVSWIYKLRKEELNQELQKFRLDLTGTVEEKRKRLIMFMRHGLSSPQPPRGLNTFVYPPPPPPAPLLRPTVTAAPLPIPPMPLDPLSIRKWNTSFNGRGDPAAFIERLDEVCAYANLEHDQLLPVLPELLQGTPLMWYRNNKRFWRTWTDFLRDFRTLYFPVNYLEDLEAEIGRRLQRADEPVVDYFTDLQTLIRRHGGMTSEQELRWLYRNLLPDYRQYIKKDDFRDVPTLTIKAKEFETLRREVRQMYSNSPYQAMTATRLPPRTTSNTIPGTRPRQAPRLPAPAEQRRPQRPTPEAQMPPQPSTTRQAPGEGNQVEAPSRNVAVNSVCWRCGETGHFRTQCTARPKLFCSRCGREGTLTRDCGCRQPEN